MQLWRRSFDRVLCISPHPDDVELSMFGTILKYPQTRFEVLCCSIGGRYDTSSSSLRHGEIRSFWEESGCKNVNLIFLEGFLTNKDEGAWIRSIEDQFPIFIYDAICVPPSTDTHFEHRLVNQIGRALVRGESSALLEYRTVSAGESWTPNFYVDIQDEYERKVAHLQSIGTQSGKVYFSEPVLSALNSDVASLKRGTKKVEMYRLLSLTCT